MHPSWMFLAAVEGWGPAAVHPLLNPDLDLEVLGCDGAIDTVVESLPPAARTRWLDPATRDRAAAVLLAARSHGLGVLYPGHPHWPRRLGHTPLRPLALFVRGDPEVLNRDLPHIAVVGSRTPTAYGVLAAADFAGTLARAGALLWSGLAVGVDALAHRAALEAGVPTVAVLAGGLDSIYPPQNQRLADEIVDAGGALLSEMPVGTKPTRGHFPRRNRILAGATTATLVVEAGLGSGSLHTARFALEAGATVFAVPGPYTSPRSRGSHQLLEDGAGVAADPESLLRQLDITRTLQGQEPQRTMEFAADEVAVLRLLGEGPRPSDLLQRESRLDRQRFLEVVLELSERGAVRRLPGDLLGLKTAL